MGLKYWYFGNLTCYLVFSAEQWTNQYKGKTMQYHARMIYSSIIIIYSCLSPDSGHRPIDSESKQAGGQGPRVREDCVSVMKEYNPKNTC